MAYAGSAPARTRGGARSARAGGRPAARSAAPRTRVRWDRLGRVAMLFVLCVLLYLYISPARSLWRAIGESRARQADVAALTAADLRLAAEQASLGTPAAVEQQARGLGLVRPGERAYVISGLPAN